ncbi:hypothetical protein PEC302107_13570 [Pectobacterium araliae]|nr:hypothetical protein PEC302107_13570 [Pectobacterium carotovorum subsp. carotovorum]
MATISHEQYVLAYAIGCRVYNNEITISEGIKILNESLSFNKNTAEIYIKLLRWMLNGEVFKRRVNTNSFKYYLTKIRDDFGIDGFREAIKSTKLHINYHENKYNTKSKALRSVVEHLEKSINNANPFSELITEFNIQVDKALSDSSATRKKRLSVSSKHPEKRLIYIEFFVRNPDVVAEVLLRADGKCERCSSDAPFLRRRNNTPYLEVHHKIPLAEGGEDTVENAIALCPNCHRYLHYGKAL